MYLDRKLKEFYFLNLRKIEEKKKKKKKKNHHVQNLWNGQHRPNPKKPDGPG